MEAHLNSLLGKGAVLVFGHGARALAEPQGSPGLRRVSHFLPPQVQRSQSVVVVGGGSAGVEMAAEIKTEFPEKEVGMRPCLWALSPASLRVGRGGGAL